MARVPQAIAAACTAAEHVQRRLDAHRHGQLRAGTQRRQNLQGLGRTPLALGPLAVVPVQTAQPAQVVADPEPLPEPAAEGERLDARLDGVREVAYR